jgi:hypothetical protein
MARQIDFRSASPHSADDVYATLVDPDYLRARLERMGGPGAALLEHSADVEGGRYRLRHGLDKANLPSMVQSLVPGDLVIERTESVRRLGAGDYDGDVDVRILGTPATALGRMRLRDTADGSEFLVRADVTVQVPLIGGRIEAVIAEQVQNMLAAETAFTLHWLDSPR